MSISHLLSSYPSTKGTVKKILKFWKNFGTIFLKTQNSGNTGVKIRARRTRVSMSAILLKKMMPVSLSGFKNFLVHIRVRVRGYLSMSCPCPRTRFFVSTELWWALECFRVKIFENYLEILDWDNLPQNAAFLKIFFEHKKGWSCRINQKIWKMCDTSNWWWCKWCFNDQSSTSWNWNFWTWRDTSCSCIRFFICSGTIQKSLTLAR